MRSGEIPLSSALVSLSWWTSHGEQVEALLPRVGEAHAPYLGFKAEDIINDHDIALGCTRRGVQSPAATTRPPRRVR